MIYIEVVCVLIETRVNEILLGVDYDAAIVAISTASLERYLNMRY